MPEARSRFPTRTHGFGTFECESNGIGAGHKWPAKNIGDVGGFVILSRLPQRSVASSSAARDTAESHADRFRVLDLSSAVSWL